MLKQLTVQCAAIRSTVPSLCAIFIALHVCGAVRADEPVIRMAGTFNNWTTSNDEYRLTKVGDHYEVVRFWQCGRYEFKFVFDGTWSKHLGMGDDGKLSQPGRDIELRVEQSGEYKLILENKLQSWRFEARPALRPHSIIIIRHGAFANSDLDSDLFRDSHSDVILDGQLSISRPGNPIRKWQWKTMASDGRVVSLDRSDLIQENPALRVLDVKVPGEYRIELTVDDGKYRDTSVINTQLGVKLDGPTIFGDQERSNHEHVMFTFDPATSKQLRPDLRVERVEVVGDFNGWRPGSLSLFGTSRGFFKRPLKLPDGLHHYKFLVNGCIFFEDPDADPKYRETDGKRGFNSGFRIGVDPATLGAEKADDVNEKAVKHDPADAAYFASIGNELVTIHLRTLAGDTGAAAVQFFDTGNAPQGEPIALSNADSRDGFDYWSAVCTPRRGPPRYTFLIEDGKEHCILDADGPHSFPANTRIALKPRPFAPDTGMSFKTPDWAKRAVWYQIFPERFRNGDASNDPPTTVPWRHEWYKAFKGPREGNAEKSKSRKVENEAGAGYTESGDFWEFIFDRRYGGDIQGVQEKLPYLRKLGINAIYFNPMFLAESMHKYDASDYRHIDDYFGVKNSLRKVKGESTDPKTWRWSETDRIFLDFIKEAHRQGFKIVLDGVFNHVGRDFWAFKDVLKHGEKSEYVGWFDITSFKPFHYKAWDKDDGSLPRLKHDDALGLAKPVREHLFAVTRRWMDPDGDGDPSDGIDGWRLDVAADINANFWRDWRKLVKSINPDGYIVAELWEESKSWLDGQTFDAVMNYPFARAAQRFFVNQKKASKPSEFQKELVGNLAWYAPQVNYVLQNLYCSHDTDRVTSMFMNPDLEYDKANRQQDNGPKYVVKRPTAECYKKFKHMVCFQMTFLGAPMIYYGDEVGMYGADDPSDRKPMWWDDLMPFDDPDEHIEPGLFEHHQRMIAIRNTYAALQLGSFEPLTARDDHGVFAFCRSLNAERVVVVFNNSDHAHRLDLESPWPDGTPVDRADDPKAFEVVEARDEGSRAVVRSTGKHKSSLKIEKGRLHGCMIEPRTAGIFVKS